VAIALTSSASATFPPDSFSAMMPEPTTAISRNAVATRSTSAAFFSIEPYDILSIIKIRCERRASMIFCQMSKFIHAARYDLPLAE
jgi:hypothetical protein